MQGRHTHRRALCNAGATARTERRARVRSAVDATTVAAMGLVIAASVFVTLVY